MIFVTVGAQMPFDRLVRTVDQWAGASGRPDVFAQIGASDYQPAHVEWRPFLDTAEMRRRYAAAELIVAHAGTGTILTALQLGKPILVLPRRAALQETRNDHQVATADRFRALGWVGVARDEQELRTLLECPERIPAGRRIGETASPRLLERLRAFVAAG